MVTQCVEIAADGIVRAMAASGPCQLAISSPGFFEMTSDEGKLVAMAIVTCWGAGAVIRALAQLFNHRGDSDE
ncbi:hypothetical protein [Jeongeupia chitinilytica]|uniref:Uncharacterized protein n=1 Tax=Jeongeupia chitinilytica TaxID=1041641 RepID=A0ABQ3GZV1_9NEIS|nr:hypothetical protein [Jeongeupia chitinilytica]GHD60788.1 hypothetical protein GCM10007350_14360 [Jeongeupia chitinilytica]